MSCSQWQSALDAYADESCPPEELAAFEAHLRECPACAAEALARVQSKRAVRDAAARFVPAPEFRLQIEQMVQKGGKSSLSPRWTSQWRFRFAFAVLALIAFSIVTPFVWMHHAARQQAIAELVDLHVATMASPNPVDVVSTDRHTVKPWFQGKLPFTFNIPELQNSPFRLIGGKLIFFQGQSAAQLVFSSGKHQVSVFVFQTNSQDNPLGKLLLGSSALREKGFSVETWQSAGLDYVAISDSNPADVHALSELLRAAAGS